MLDYALDLQNFQKESHDKIIIPIVVATEAKTIENSFIVKGNIAEPLFCNRGNIGETIALIDEKFVATVSITSSGKTRNIFLRLQ